MAKNSASTRSISAGSLAAPLAVLGTVVGIVFVVFYFIAEKADKHIAFISTLGTWNLLVAAIALIVAVLAFRKARATAFHPQSAPHTRALGNRWAAPAMIGSALIGLVWIVVFYVTNGTTADVPIITDLGNWNLVIGMGFIVGAFGFAMKWE